MELEKLLGLMKMDAENGTNIGGGNEPKEPSTSGSEEPAQSTEKIENKEPEAQNKYTDEDIDKIINRKFAEWQAKKQKEVQEAEKLAKMTVEEKYQHAEQERAELERDLARYKMGTTARGILAEKKLNVPDALLETLIAEDAETTKTNIDAYEKAFTEAVEREVQERLKGKTPRGGVGGKKITKADILNVEDTIERQRLMAENIELFK